MEYVIKNVQVPVLPAVPVTMVIPPMPKAFVIAYTKTVKDVNGVDVVIPDREERITVEQLTSQKDQLQAQIDEIDKKLSAIADLSGAGVMSPEAATLPEEAVKVEK